MSVISSHYGGGRSFNRNVVFVCIVCIEGYGGGGGKRWAVFWEEER